jgi:hypothetical protein
MALRNRVFSLESIRAYEMSSNSVKIFNPVWFYNNFQEEKKRMEIETK